VLVIADGEVIVNIALPT